MAKLGHPDGEVNLTKGAANTGIIQCVSAGDAFSGSHDFALNADLEQRLMLA